MADGADRYSDRHSGMKAASHMIGEGMRMKHWSTFLAKFAIVGFATAALIGAVGSSAGVAGASGSSTASSAPGVTSNSITVGTISTQTGPISSNFSSLIYGEKAYYDYINAQGGINGRKIDYKYALDDGGNPSEFTQLANTLINQDHVFAVTGIATAFFTPSLFVEAGTPTYGYNVTENWNGPKNLFAAGGSVIYLPAEATQVAYVARAAKAKKIAIVAYGVAASAAACQASGKGLAAAGYDVVYTDYKVAYPGTTVATDVQRMKQAGANFVLTCMDVQGNVTMARAIKQYGLKASQLWFNGNDQSTLNANESLMQGIYFYIAHVPFGAPTSEYPGLKVYLAAMKKYEPQYADNELAIQGWESAALFAAGVKAAGKNLTQANVIAQDNKLTAFTAGGLTAPTNWAKTGHKGHAPPFCAAYIQVKGDKYVPALDKGKSVFNCFDSINPKVGPVTPLPPGTPNAS
jgi:ABC-type branched-subunit amino acid transport system substrate-binding protein